MQAQHVREFVSDHLAGTMAMVALAGVAIGVASVLAIGGLMNGGAPVSGLNAADRVSPVSEAVGIGGSQGVVSQAGDLVGPGEGLNAVTGTTSAPATGQTSLRTSKADEILVGPGQGLNEFVSAGTTSSLIERPAGPGEGLMEQGLVHSGAEAAAGETESIGRNLTHPSGALIGPGEGLIPIDATSTGVTIERPFGPGEGLVNGGS
jgi:hypothetical protein